MNISIFLFQLRRTLLETILTEIYDDRTFKVTFTRKFERLLTDCTF